jgi:hypothetical protein
MTPVVARRPHNRDKASAQEADGHETRLAIIAPIIATGVLPCSGKDLLGIGEIEATLGHGPLSFRLVPAVRHLMYPQKWRYQD